MARGIGSGWICAAAVAAACAAQAATRVYWTNATGDKSIQTPGNWQDEAGNVLTAAPKTGSSASTGSILVFTNFTGTVTSTSSYQYYGYVFGEGASVTLGGSKSIYVYGGGVTHEGTGVSKLGYTTNLSAETNVFDVVHAGAELQINNSLNSDDTHVVLKRGQGTLRVPMAYGSTVNNVKEIVMQAGTLTLSATDNRLKLTDCTITFDGNDPSARIKRMWNTNPGVLLALTGGCIRETETVDNTEHGFTDDGRAFTLSLTDAVTDSRFTGTIYSKLSFLWGPTDGSQTFTFAKATHPTIGDFTVTNGTVRLEDGARFTSLATVTVKAGATLDVASGVKRAIQAAALALETGATLKVAADTTMEVGAITRDGAALPAGIYTKDNCTWVTGDGKVLTTEWPAAAAADVWNRDDFPSALAAGTETWYKGAELDGEDLALTAGAGATAVIGPLGVKTAGEGKTYTWGWPTFLYGAQEWISTNGDTLVISAPIDSLVFGNLYLRGDGNVRFAASQDSETRFVLDGPKAILAGVTVGNPVSAYGTTIYADTAGTTNTFTGRVTLHGDCSLAKGTWRFTGGVDSSGAVSMNENATVIVDDAPFVSTSRFQSYGKVVLNTPSNSIAIANHAHAASGKSRIATTVPYALWRGAASDQRLALGFHCSAKNNPSKHSHLAGVTWDLCGCDQEIASLSCSTNGSYVTSEGAAQLHYVLDTFTQNAVFGHVWYAVTNYVRFTGGAGLTYEGSRTDAMLVDVSATTGRLEVVSGRIELAAPAPNAYSGLDWPGGSWPNAAAAVMRGGTLVLGHKAAIGKGTDVCFVGGDGRLEIPSGVTVRCRDLYFDGVRQARGTWGASGARHTDARFSGGGLLNVVGDGQGAVIVFR